MRICVNECEFVREGSRGNIMANVLRYQLRLIALWAAFLLGLMFHTQLALMPLFHGISVASSHTHEQFPLSAIFWLMLLFFVIPLFSIVLTPFFRHQRGLVLNFALTLVYSVLNLVHFAMDVLVDAPSYQLTLMLILVGIGLGLNVVTFQWMKVHGTYPQHSSVT